MKRFLSPIFIIILLGTLASATYSWTGKLNVGDQIYVNDLTIQIDKNKADNRTAAVIYKDGQLLGLIYAGSSKTFEGLEISVSEFNDYAILSISSDEPFTISFNAVKDYSAEISRLKEENAKLKQENEQLKKQVENLENENKQLKRRVSDLEKQLKEAKAQDVSKLQARINNLTKENRELKAQIANQTNLINQLKAKAQFLEQQNNEYRTLITKLLEEQAQKSEKSYIEKAKKERLIGSIIIKTLIFAGLIVGLAGFLLYRGKKSWEYPL
ncbi:hypothetical protein [Pyrococcus yayanosii]|uniref:Chromosome partition protein Smc n=1 Tax=Pyrococcus yayanosii (strain CH1 / JCM 16557) TaxID=529709 RepID=F8AJF6_PYRYC|nr:hypothetical protein [Pyrococcus yayanosii]AEH25096.1 hypothetical protein PYCH_14260 [Pyrococcus yayanosii CH1]